jgi:hypothetical protein
MLAWIACYLSVVGPVVLDEPGSPKRDLRIPNLMREAHMKGRQVYRSLDQLLISGRSTAEERKRYLAIYAKLRELKPPQGTVESWQYDLDRITDLVKRADAAKDEQTILDAGAKLLSATNCNACHEKYRYAPKPVAGEVAPKSLEVGLKAIATGGKHWSAPEKLDLGETKYLQPGRRVVVWPADDVVYDARRSDDGFADIYVKFKWALRPGADFASSSPGLMWYNYYDLGNKNSVAYYEARPDARTREGEFTVSFRVWAKDRAAGEYELAFVPQKNDAVWVPLGNFVKVRYRLPK